MSILNKPFYQYFVDIQWGIVFLAGVATLRFLMNPVFGVSYDSGSPWVSLTVALPLVMVIYAVRAARESWTYSDLFGIAAALSLIHWLLVGGAIALDVSFGWETYYTAPTHVGAVDPRTHLANHTIAGLVNVFVLWGMGCLLRRFAAP